MADARSHGATGRLTWAQYKESGHCGSMKQCRNINYFRNIYIYSSEVTNLGEVRKKTVENLHLDTNFLDIISFGDFV